MVKDSAYFHGYFHAVLFHVPDTRNTRSPGEAENFSKQACQSSESRLFELALSQIF